MKWAVLALVVACSKTEAPPPAEGDKPPALLPPEELKRADEACNEYVAKVCACAETVPAKQEDCALSKAIPDAIGVAKRLAANPKADREDAVQAAGNVRKTVRACIEKTAKLASEGCP